MRSALPCAIVMLTVVAGDVHAQERSGLIGGFSFGGGMLGIRGRGDDGVALVQQDAEREPVVGFDLHIGGMLSSKTAAMFVLMADFGGGSKWPGSVDLRVGDRQVSFDSSTTSLGSGGFGGVIQHWVRSALWIRGGAGIGFLTRDFTVGSDDSYLMLTLDRGYGPLFTAGAGVEVWRKGNFVADVELHLSGIRVGGAGVFVPSVQVGCNWY